MFPFHDGEREAQRWAGVAESSGSFIRTFMPEQHREFFAMLPFALVGSVDDQGQPTASLVAAPPGNIWAPSEDTLALRVPVELGDPLRENLKPGRRVGVLGLEPHARRRNRANGRIIEVADAGFAMQVEQSFGNCPKYITQRRVTYAPSWSATGAHALGERGARQQVRRELTTRERNWLAQADTFFLASAHPEALSSEDPTHGVDISHRGGPQGFVRFSDDNSFAIPDFPGNNLFNSIGNVLKNPKVGLLFWNFEDQSVLQIHALAQAARATDPRSLGTNRCLEFEITGVHELPNGCPLHSEET